MITKTIHFHGFSCRNYFAWISICRPIVGSRKSKGLRRGNAIATIESRNHIIPAIRYAMQCITIVRKSCWLSDTQAFEISKVKWSNGINLPPPPNSLFLFLEVRKPKRNSKFQSAIPNKVHFIMLIRFSIRPWTVYDRLVYGYIRTHVFGYGMIAAKFTTGAEVEPVIWRRVPYRVAIQGHHLTRQTKNAYCHGYLSSSRTYKYWAIQWYKVFTEQLANTHDRWSAFTSLFLRLCSELFPLWSRPLPRASAGGTRAIMGSSHVRKTTTRTSSAALLTERAAAVRSFLEY